MNVKIRKGTRIRIIKDIRPRWPTGGKIGTYVGDEDREAWLLVSCNGAYGKIVCESFDLCEGCVEWNPDQEPFPKRNCGIRVNNPIFRLDDGTFIDGGKCLWEFVNPKIERRTFEVYRDFLRKLGTPEEQIPSVETLKEQRAQIV